MTADCLTLSTSLDASWTLVKIRTGSSLPPTPVSLFIVKSGRLVNPNPPLVTFAPIMRPSCISNSTSAPPVPVPTQAPVPVPVPVPVIPPSTVTVSPS